MKRFVRWAIPLVIAASAITAGSGGPSHRVFAAHTTAKPHSAVKLARNARFGKILTNAKGRTLYYLTSDRAGKPTCLGGCAQAWPPALKSRSARFTRLHVTGKFGTVANPGRGRQITYNGWPLYTFSGDSKPGETNGAGVAGVWFVATPKLKRRGAGPAPSPSATCMPSVYGC